MVPEGLTKNWKALNKHLSELGSISFPRIVLNEGEPTKQFLFRDASKAAYGSAAHAVQDGQSSLVFAKAKVAFLQSHSLPTLELLLVFLALKCFSSLKEAFKDISVEV